MKPDDELCLCFHVTRRKVENFLRVEAPRSATQLSECHGAGTGCGWCRPFLRKLYAAHAARRDAAVEPLPDTAAYASARGAYIDAGKGAPPAGGPAAS